MWKGIAAAFFTMAFLIMLGLLPIMYNFCGNKIACVWLLFSIVIIYYLRHSCGKNYLENDCNSFLKIHKSFTECLLTFKSKSSII